MEDKYISELAEIITGIKEKEMAENFLKNILTPAELDEISRRLQIFKMLEEGHSQREIAEKLGVGIATVSRGAREFKYGKQNFFDKFLR